MLTRANLSLPVRDGVSKRLLACLGNTTGKATATSYFRVCTGTSMSQSNGAVAKYFCLGK